MNTLYIQSKTHLYRNIRRAIQEYVCSCRQCLATERDLLRDENKGKEENKTLCECRECVCWTISIECVSSFVCRRLCVILLLLLFALVSSSHIRWSALILLRSICLYAYVSYSVERLVIWDLIGSSNEQLHDSCVIFEFHFYHTIDADAVVVVFFVGVLILSCVHISLNLRTNSQKLWVHFFFLCPLHILSFNVLSLWNGEIASITNHSTTFFGKRKKLRKETKESKCCFGYINILSYVCCIL